MPILSFGRSFPEIMSVLCPVQITVTGPSIEDVRTKGELPGGGSRENGHPYKTDLFFQ